MTIRETDRLRSLLTLCWIGPPRKSLPCPSSIAPRGTGKSNYSWTKLMTHAVNLVTGLSVVPLQLAVWLGFLVTCFGVCLLAFVMVSYFLHGSQVPGFTFLAVVILLFSGVQLCVLGIIGEYLSRVYLRLRIRAGKASQACGLSAGDVRSEDFERPSRRISSSTARWQRRG